MRAWCVVLLLVAVAGARDKRAARLASQAAKLATQHNDLWRDFVLERDKFPDDELKQLIAGYEKAVDLFHQSLEIEEFGGINGQIVVLARRVAKARFAQVRRKRAREPPRPPPSKTKPERPQEPEPPEEEEPRPRPEPPPEPPRREREDDGPAPWPTLEEEKKDARRGKQSLRNFVMNTYFARRKSKSLLTRCGPCNGRGKRPSGQLDNRRRIIYLKCGTCDGVGQHLNVNPARIAFWLVKSPLYRADAQNKADFDAQLEEWHADARKVPEIYKRVSLVSMEYHGLWAKAKLKEKVSVATDDLKRRATVERTVVHTFLRLGKRWFLYDEEADADWFSPDAAD